jgi:hypothetical protein
MMRLIVVRFLICVLFHTCFPDTSVSQEIGSMPESILPCDSKHLFGSSQSPLSPCLKVSIASKSRFTVYCLAQEINPDIRYVSYLETEVCTDGHCKLARVWMYWNKIGQYAGYEPSCAFPLTKSDHEDFSTDDYDQLHQLLSDPNSSLKALSFEDLTQRAAQETVSPTTQPKVDAISQATSPALSEIVVKNAVFTCYSLWHLVYGELGAAIHQLVKDRMSDKFLKNLFLSQNEKEVSWAIAFISTSPQKYLHYTPSLLTFIRTGTDALRESALNFFTRGIVTTQTLEELCNTLEGLDPSAQSHILEKISQLNPDVGTVTQILRLYENGTVDVTLLHYVYQLVDEKHLDALSVATILDRLASSPNSYVKNMTRQLLQQAKP